MDALLNSLCTRIRKEDQDHVLKGRAFEKAVLSGPFRLLPSNRIGVIWTYPVYRSTLSPSKRLEEHTVATAGPKLLELVSNASSLHWDAQVKLASFALKARISDRICGIMLASECCIQAHYRCLGGSLWSSLPCIMYSKTLTSVMRYIGGLLEFKSFVGYVLRQLGNQTVLVTVHDITNSSHSLMYGQNYAESNQPMMHKSKLELADPFRKYLMICIEMHQLYLGSQPFHIVKIRQGALRIRGLEVQLQDANTANSQLRADASEIKQPAYIIIKTLAMLLKTELSSIQGATFRLLELVEGGRLH
ncbi:hypothetical protein NL676_004409 [Syzygium grande]|nr:hypothetical protein NL676_004409 [Syzygium grande]